MIRALPTMRQRYAEKLIAEGTISKTQNEAMVADYRQALDEGRVVYPPAPARSAT
jgi:2-oxoglutarate dehydrogenase complex dehydrogenase (E1) component-like enzyme